MVCEPIFRKIKKDEPKVWDENYQKAFEKIKAYLFNPPLLALAFMGHPLRLYLRATDTSVGAMLSQEVKGKENTIYYISNKLLEYETRYSLLEKLTITQVWATKSLCHHMLAHNVHVICKLDPLKFLFEKPGLNDRLSLVGHVG